MDIALGRLASAAEIETTLQRFFSESTVRVSEDLEQILEDPVPDVFATAFPLEIPGFPVGLSIDRWPGSGDAFQKMAIRLSQHLSQHLACPAMCDGSGYGPYDCPYWSIVWIDGSPYLADDTETDAEPPLPPKILHKLTAV